jgi:subtilisin family serine protease
MKNFFTYLVKGFFIIILITNSSFAVGQNNIRIKFKPELENALDVFYKRPDKKNDKGVIQVGLAGVDNLFSKHQVSELKRVFRPAGKYEERHKNHNLHLWYEFNIDSINGKKLVQLVSEFKNLAEVQHAESRYKKKHIISNKKPNTTTVNNFLVDDPRYQEQWHFWNTGQTGGTPGADIRLQNAWNLETGSDQVIVAVMDGGIDYSHEDLNAAMWINEAEANGRDRVDDDHNGYIDDIYGYGFGDNTGSIFPNNHGTHVAGTVGAVNNNGIGVSGIAGGSGTGNSVKLMSCAIYGAISSGGIAEAFVYSADMGAVISQNSWSYINAGVYEQSILDAIDYFISNAGYSVTGEQIGPMAGGTVIFSAGNNNSDSLWYPGCYEPVMGVASTDHNDRKAYYSNYGNWVDISAPGGVNYANIEEGILSTLPDNSYGYLQGTSMAAPHVSGVAGLLVSKFGGNGFTNTRLWSLIIENTDSIEQNNPGYTGLLGSGRLNAHDGLLTFSDATLNTLLVSDSTLSGFDKNDYNYYFIIPPDTTDIPEVTALPSQPEATIIISPTTELPGKTIIEVTAEDGVTQSTYQVFFVKEVGLPVDFESLVIVEKELYIIPDTLVPGNNLGLITKKTDTSMAFGNISLTKAIDFNSNIDKISMYVISPIDSVEVTLKLKNENIGRVIEDSDFVSNASTWQKLSFYYPGESSNYFNEIEVIFRIIKNESFTEEMSFLIDNIENLVCNSCNCFTADIDSDGKISIDDLKEVLKYYGNSCEFNCPADIDKDGAIGIDDLKEVLKYYGIYCL